MVKNHGVLFIFCMLVVNINTSPRNIGVELPGYPKYRVVKNQWLSWNSARLKCQKYGGDLVCFENDQKWLDVGKALVANFPGLSFFIGGRGDGKGNYLWSSNNAEIPKGHIAWYENLKCTGCERQEPNYGGGTGACVLMSTKRGVDKSWFDDPCFWKRNFICEFKS